ncbi:hypothetical protein [Salirhabdus salicampi]|uniref:hypothetical protein n=1 Tax=Salirhabdus salicampi TaxID=476102 RepID=UPI0020C3BF47|nr:hypothetical protein [Salirhabdus salicampi]MCP8615225.1 hypothetical protein [Salirhabdus salicampi]
MTMYFYLLYRPAEPGEHIYCLESGNIYKVDSILGDGGVIYNEKYDIICGYTHEFIKVQEYLVLELVDPEGSLG